MGGWSLTPLVLACFLVDEEDIAVPSRSLNNRLGLVYGGESVGQTDEGKRLGNLVTAIHNASATRRVAGKAGLRWQFPPIQSSRCQNTRGGS